MNDLFFHLLMMHKIRFYSVYALFEMWYFCETYLTPSSWADEKRKSRNEGEEKTRWQACVYMGKLECRVRFRCIFLDIISSSAGGCGMKCSSPLLIE